jgi:hypothetical protein
VHQKWQKGAQNVGYGPTDFRRAGVERDSQKTQGSWTKPGFDVVDADSIPDAKAALKR